MRRDCHLNRDCCRESRSPVHTLIASVGRISLVVNMASSLRSGRRPAARRSRLNTTDNVGDSAVRTLRPPRATPADRPFEYLQRMTTHNRVLIDGQHFAVREQPQRRVIQQREVRAEDQRALRERPQRDHRLLLVERQARVTRLAPSRRRPQLAERKHVGIGPLARLEVEGRPRCEAVELAFERLRKGLARLARRPRDPRSRRRCATCSRATRPRLRAPGSSAPARG